MLFYFILLEQLQICGRHLFVYEIKIFSKYTMTLKIPTAVGTKKKLFRNILPEVNALHSNFFDINLHFFFKFYILLSQLLLFSCLRSQHRIPFIIIRNSWQENIDHHTFDKKKQSIRIKGMASEFSFNSRTWPTLNLRLKFLIV